jgi:APA family basic amino acid/polyamine antiporter
VIFIALTVIALFVLRRKLPGDLAFRTPGYPATPIIFLVLITLMLFLLAGHNPAQAFLGIAVVALGLPAYYIIFRRKVLALRTEDPERGTTLL